MSSRVLVQTRCQAPPKGAELGKESRVGKAPILIPKGVQLTLTRDLLKVKVSTVYLYIVSYFCFLY